LYAFWLNFVVMFRAMSLPVSGSEASVFAFSFAAALYDFRGRPHAGTESAETQFLGQ
jgi:hypothetical protein